ncbi:DUF5313 family protein [Actinophytocola sp.]|uniref:DUF5313 family protein n=1 Tax=Actinophytocola sp. TaxID=1872138 RepID=UPI002D80CE59|nr:DUF5313 family protein [Actinophytocola sp.]HET9139721.1 DUF5313 family protein [Actinophytocola sp.]
MGRVRAKRPNPARWLWYAVGGRLPGEYREWVLYDLTCGTWVLRHLSRAVVPHLAWLLLLLLPIPLSLRLGMIITGMFIGLFFSLSFMEDSCERRLIQHGFPVGLNRTIREESDPAQRAELAAMYAAYYTTDPDV